MRSYLDLAKVDVPELWLGVPVAWSLLPEATWFAGRTIALFLVFLLSVVCITAAAQALDDVQGARDGTDDTNYAPDKLRRRSRKPLIEGRLTQRQAILFAKITTLVGVGGVFAAWLVADLTPLWFPLATGASIALAVQYSYGMSFSYRIFAGGEVVLAVTTASTVILAYALVAGTVSVAALACGWLLGMGILQVSVCSS
ncbi:MAG: UbiA family prenyltransferase, partial [Thermocrispum sp.]